jgi:hypothetical protein
MTLPTVTPYSDKQRQHAHRPAGPESTYPPRHTFMV